MISHEFMKKGWPTSNAATRLFSAAVSFRSVLNLRLRGRLPLHVGRRVGAAAFERNAVIDDVALPSLGIAGLFHELSFRGGTALDPAIAVPLRNRGFLRN